MSKFKANADSTCRQLEVCTHYAVRALRAVHVELYDNEDHAAALARCGRAAARTDEWLDELTSRRAVESVHGDSPGRTSAAKKDARTLERLAGVALNALLAVEKRIANGDDDELVLLRIANALEFVTSGLEKLEERREKRAARRRARKAAVAQPNPGPNVPVPHVA